MKKLMVCFVLATASMVQAAPAKKAPVAPAPMRVPSSLYDFKGVPLEISLEDFRARPHPDGTGDAKVICTGEKVKRFSTESEPIAVMLFSDVEKALGVKKCAWFTAIEDKRAYRYAGDIVSLGLAGSGYASRDYSFSFVPDPKDGVLRLYAIEAVSNRNAFSDVLAGLTGKWGAPKLEKGTVQNRMGASFPQVTATWNNPIASITIIDRWLKIDEMVILVAASRLNAVVQQAKDAKKASIPNSI